MKAKGNIDGMQKYSTVLIIAVLSLVLVLSSISVPDCSAAGSSSLTVEVHNTNGNPVVGANVTITGPETHFAVTGARGIVAFSNIADGSYDIVASAKEYPNAAPHTVQVHGAVTTQVQFDYTKAFFTFSPLHPKKAATVTFNADQSTSSGEITVYDWDFGDNSTGSGVSPTHSYANSGSYVVKLTVTSTWDTSKIGTATYTAIVPVTSTGENYFSFLWLLLLLPLLLIPFLIYWRSRRYYVIIQARVPINRCHPHCPGNDTECDNCKLTPC
jgi:hypothetical protein